MSRPDRLLAFNGELTVVPPSGFPTRLVATGSSLRWEVASLRSALGGSGFPRRRRAQVARTLDRLGTDLTIVQEGEEVLTIGSGRPSFLGWLLLGSSRIRLRRPLSWLKAT